MVKASVASTAEARKTEIARLASAPLTDETLERSGAGATRR
jgi:hypothetical protein